MKLILSQDELILLQRLLGDRWATYATRYGSEVVLPCGTVVRYFKVTSRQAQLFLNAEELEQLAEYLEVDWAHALRAVLPHATEERRWAVQVDAILSKRPSPANASSRHEAEERK